MKKPWKRVTICLSESGYKNLRALAGAEGISMAALIRRLLLDFEGIRVKGSTKPS
jgi:hypothetical protein